MPPIANSIRDLSAAFIVAGLLISALILGRAILVPLAIAGIACFVLAPLVRSLTKFRVPNTIAASLVVLATTLTVVGAATALSSQLLSLTAQLPEYRSNVMAKVEGVVGNSVPTSVVGRAIDAIETYQQAVYELLQTRAAQNPSSDDKEKPEQKVVLTNGDSSAWQKLGVIVEPLALIALTFLFSLFLLNQYKDLRDRVVRLLGTDNMTDTTEAMADAGKRLSDLFIGQAILNLGFGVFVGLALTVIGVPNAPLWGVVAMVMRWVPFIGVYIAALPPILLAAAVDPGWTKALLTLGLFAIGEPVMG